MPWFNVDDGFAFHRKAVLAGNSAIGLWARAGSWCAKELTDGFVPDHMVPTMGTRHQADKLVRSGLWQRDDLRGGFQFHEWSEDGRNPTRADVLKKREQAADKKRRQRSRNDHKTEDTQVDESCPQGTDGGVPQGVPGGVNVPPPLPSPPTSPNGEVTTSRAAALEAFGRFYAAYPRKVGPKAAEKAWLKAIKDGADMEKLISAAQRFARSRSGRDQQYTPHPATWLNQGRWDDEPEPTAFPPPNQTDANIAAFLNQPSLYALPGGETA